MHSAYTGAVNIRLGKELFTLQDVRKPLTPLSIAMQEGAMGQLQAAAGQPVRVEQHTLYIGSLCASFKDATLWNPQLLPAPQSACLLPALWQVLSQGAAQWGGLAAVVLRQPAQKQWLDVARLADEYLQGIGQAFCQDDELQAAVAAAQLIGLGQGLTPSGDDFLVGMLALLTLRQNEPRPAALRQAMVAQILPGIARTNDISAAFLQHACAGNFASGIHRLFAATTPRQAQQAAQSLAALGHTSGLDLLSGIYYANNLLSTLPTKECFSHDISLRN